MTVGVCVHVRAGVCVCLIVMTNHVYLLWNSEILQIWKLFHY